MKKVFVLAGVAYLLSACGGEDNAKSADLTATPTPAPTVAPIAYDVLQSPSPSQSALQAVADEQLFELLKNGVRRDVANVWVAARAVESIAEDSDSVAQAAATPEPSASLDYSDTNTQILGVDEADHVKYDGNSLFVHAFAKYNDGALTQDRIRIFDTDSLTATATEVADIPVEDSNYSNLQMYLLDGTSAAIGAESLITLKTDGFTGWCGVGLPEWDWYSEPDTTTVDIYSLNGEDSPSLAWELELEGMLHDSRKVDDMLYLVTSYVPQVSIFEDLDGAVKSESADGDNPAVESELASLSISDLVPGYRINGGERQLLHVEDSCLANADLDASYGYRSLHHIVAVDLRNQRVANSICLSTPVENIYSSRDAMYLVATEYGNDWQDSYTVLHKFNLDGDNIEYAATGAVDGRLGWRSTPAFRMDEHEGLMRIITTAWPNGSPEHKLWVLQENSDNKTLELVARLPEEGSNDVIGKPGEDIYAVRFWGDRAYVVTFEQIDPLYVLDLTDPTAPLIAGELELPGFSTYLHPIDDDYIFGFGQESDNLWQGVKAVLFDVSNPAQPSIAGQVQIGGTWAWSDALYDYKSFTFLRASDDQLRITFPVTANGIVQGGGLDDHIALGDNNRMLALLEVNGLDGGSATLDYQGGISVGEGQQSWSNYSAFSRGILHGDAVFYVDEPDVWGAFWQDPNTVNGPFTGAGEAP